MGKTTTDAVRIYVANLGAYNAGHLIGEWIDLPMDADSLQERLNTIVAAVDSDGDVFGEEWAMHDYEAPFTINEYDNVTRINEIAEIIESSDEDADIIAAILGNWSDVDDGLKCLEDRDYMVYDGCDDMSDVAERWLGETGGLEGMPEHLRYYFDYEAYGRDMAIEGSFISYDRGYVQIMN